MGSPCIDAGTSDGAPTIDIEGNERYDDCATPNTGGGTHRYYDMGAYEYLGDYDGDGIPDDGSNSCIVGDHPCATGETEDCDDNCPKGYNPNQADEGDGDGVGDVCDNCPQTPNGPKGGTCTSGDIGQSCMSDDYCDPDGFCSMEQEDSDGDEVGDACDNCPDDYNPDQKDNDLDGLGDICDPDDDDDGISDDEDNCPDDYNPDQKDNDLDGSGNVCDSDDDNDSIPDEVEGEDDPDEDGIPNWFDTDSDGDGADDSEEVGSDPNNPVDTDGDGTPNYLDLDSDDDDVLDNVDNCRLVPNFYQEDEEDSDGSGDVCDNCPETPNGPNGGTCIRGTIGEACMNDGDCGNGGFCSMAQEDADGDGVGDVCDEDTYWAKTYGGSDWDEACSIQQTIDGGYIVAGYSHSFGAGNRDFWVLKLDERGVVYWQNTYGGSKFDYARSIQQTTDGGYIVAGYTYSFDDIWVLKLESNGDVSWQKTYGGCYAYYIKQTIDGGYIVAGYTETYGVKGDLLLLKLESNGDVSWQKIYGWGATDDYAYSIQQTSDGGYIVAGYTIRPESDGGREIWVLKLESNGDVSWQKTYGGSVAERGSFIQQTIDGGYIVAGYTHSFGAGTGDFWVLKLDSNGNISWQKTYGGSDRDEAYSIQQTSDGGYIVGGYTESFGAGGKDAWVLKLDSSGDVSWQKTYGGSNDDEAYSIQQTSDDGYIIGGYTESFGAGGEDAWVLKLDSNGDIPDCDIIGSSSATVYDTSVSGQDITAHIYLTHHAIIDTSITPQDTSANISAVCWYYIYDYDSDGIPDGDDNCPDDYNPDQKDNDLDGLGDICDPDDDDDGISDDEDNCPDDYNLGQGDEDDDGIGDACDNCLSHTNGPSLGTCVKTKSSMIVSYRVGDPKDFIICTSEADCEATGGTCQLEQGDCNENGCGDVCECYADGYGSLGVPDGKVTNWDFIIWKEEFGEKCSEEDPCQADYNEDGKVTNWDFILFKHEFGKINCPECD